MTGWAACSRLAWVTTTRRTRPATTGSAGVPRYIEVAWDTADSSSRVERTGPGSPRLVPPINGSGSTWAAGTKVTGSRRAATPRRGLGAVARRPGAGSYEELVERVEHVGVVDQAAVGGVAEVGRDPGQDARLVGDPAVPAVVAAEVQRAPSTRTRAGVRWPSPAT